jgi:hypothetical protein
VPRSPYKSLTMTATTTTEGHCVDCPLNNDFGCLSNMK